MRETTIGREHAERIFAAAVAAVAPHPLVASALTTPGELCDALAGARRIRVVGAGKAGAGMVSGVETALAARLGDLDGIVNVPAPLARPTRRITLNPCRPAGCNEPTPAAAAGTGAMIELARSARPDDVLLVLLSGGASALMPAPVPAVTLSDKVRLTRVLAASGADIVEINAVRKHLSRVKGGRLAAESGAGTTWGLLISDVAGDRPDVIGSGPTAPDPSTYEDAYKVIECYGLTAVVPSVTAYLNRGRRGEEPETPKSLPASCRNIVLAGTATALAGAETEARRLGYLVMRSGYELAGDLRVAARSVADAVRTADQQLARPWCLLTGGEVTVRLPETHGLGGRNMELASTLGQSLGAQFFDGVTVLCAGTDGEDGPTDAAGAVVDADVLNGARQAGLDAAQFLERHDTYRFFEAAGGLVRTGLTGTNVRDVCVVVADVVR